MGRKASIIMVNNKITEAEENLLHVYNRFPIVLDHGEDVYLYDAEGKNIWILLQELQFVVLDIVIKN